MRPCNIFYIIHILFFPDRESTLFVVIKTVPFIPFRRHHREVEDFFKTTRKCVIKKLALIPTTKLIIEHAEDYQLPPRVTRRKNFLLRETLKVIIVDSCRMELVLATILEVLNKRWKMLDLISVLREAQRTLAIKDAPPSELFTREYSRQISRTFLDIYENLSFLPRLQNKELVPESSRP